MGMNLAATPGHELNVAHRKRLSNPSTLPVMDIDQRLVVGFEFIQFDGMPEILRQRGAELHVLVKPRAIENDPPPAFALGLVEGKISAAKKVGGSIAISGDHDDPDARSDQNLPAKNIDGRSSDATSGATASCASLSVFMAVATTANSSPPSLTRKRLSVHSALNRDATSMSRLSPAEVAVGIIDGP
jgi:hypothetical protein